MSLWEPSAPKGPGARPHRLHRRFEAELRHDPGVPIIPQDDLRRQREVHSALVARRKRLPALLG